LIFARLVSHILIVLILTIQSVNAWECKYIGLYVKWCPKKEEYGLLCQPQVIVKMIVEKQMECRLAGETEVLGENLPQHHFCPSQNPT
jgi:hypothetical protein